MKYASTFLNDYLITEGKKVSDAYTTYVWIASYLGHKSVTRSQFVREIEKSCGLKVVDGVFQKVIE